MVITSKNVLVLTENATDIVRVVSSVRTGRRNTVRVAKKKKKQVSLFNFVFNDSAVKELASKVIERAYKDNDTNFFTSSDYEFWNSFIEIKVGIDVTSNQSNC